MASSRIVAARALAFMAVVVATPNAAAQEQKGYAVNRFEPSERGSEWFAAESLDFRGSPRPAFGIVGDYSHRALAIYERNGDVRGSIVDHNMLVHAGGCNPGALGAFH